MDQNMRRGMDEALRLTLSGRPFDATAMIQRTLGGLPAWAVPSESSGGETTLSPTLSEQAGSRHAGGWRARARGAGRPSRTVARGLAEAIEIIQGTLPGALPGAPTQPGLPGALPADLTSLPTVRSQANPSRSFTDATPSPIDVQLPGRFIDCFYSSAAGARAYKLYIPSGYIGKAVPLVVMLHGCTQSPDQSAAGTRLNALAEESTFLVAYPEQTAAANRSKCWNWFTRAHQRRGEGEPSIIAGITRQAMALYHVDVRRVYVAGMSAGGAMAAIMGATYPDLYAAVGVHSGLAPGAAHDLRSAFDAMRKGGPETLEHRDNTEKAAVPTIVFHGDRDAVVNPRNAEQVLMTRAVESRKAAVGGGLWASSSRGQVPGGRAYTRFIYHGGRGSVVGERWLVHGAGHAWSGGSPADSFTDPLGPDASREMLRFFHEHPRLSETS